MLIFLSSLQALPMLQHEYLHICCTCWFLERAQYLHGQWHSIIVQKQNSKYRCNIIAIFFGNTFRNGLETPHSTHSNALACHVDF